MPFQITVLDRFYYGTILRESQTQTIPRAERIFIGERMAKIEHPAVLPPLDAHSSRLHLVPTIFFSRVQRDDGGSSVVLELWTIRPGIVVVVPIWTAIASVPSWVQWCPMRLLMSLSRTFQLRD